MFRLRYEAPSTKQSLLFALPGIVGQKNNEPNNNSVINLLTETADSAEQCSICLSELVVPSSDGNNCNEQDDHAAANILYLLATIATDTSANTPVSLKNCGHKFHLGCLWQGMQHGCGHQCPVCKKAVLSLPSADTAAASTPANNDAAATVDQFIKMLRGNMPSGTMQCQLLPSSCAGYETDTMTRGSIIINYRIGPNLQKQYHPNPGVAHSGTTRNAYLPNNTEGRDLLCRLGVAFICGLTFTVGTSLTTNRENSVTWASIHHKTSLTGGSSRHGYPDANFMSNCHEELDALSVPSSDVCSDYLRRNFGTEWLWINNSSSPTVAKVSSPVQNYFYGGGLRHPKGSGQLEGNNIRPNGGEALSCLEHSKQSVFSLMNEIQTQAFRDFVETNGLLGPVVSSDLFQVQNSSLFESFVQEVHSTLKKGEEFGIGIAFHGTVESNIASILQEGLDPAKRRGQTYGPGEYFSPRPALPIRYCRGGRKVLIFLLIYEPSNICTNDIVVVNNTHRQLPIGTISFVNTTAQADAAADSFHRHVRWLMEEKNKKESMARAARTKEKIIRLLISGEYLAASDVYNNALSMYGWPSQTWANEVSLYVYDHIRDEEQICIYFPRLPSRPKEAAHVSSLDVAKCEEEAFQAREKYEKMAKMNHNTVFPQTFPLDGAWAFRTYSVKERKELKMTAYVIDHCFDVQAYDATGQARDFRCCLKANEAGTERGLHFVLQDRDYCLTRWADSRSNVKDLRNLGESSNDVVKIGDQFDWTSPVPGYVMEWKRLH